MNKDAILEAIKDQTHAIYKNVSHDLPFHGWHHILFVHKHALRFCEELNADPFLVAAAAYVHDLNYVAKADSITAAGKDLRVDVLKKSGVDDKTIHLIETIIDQGDIYVRDNNILPEAKALSDGDTLFKALPITPILFAKLFMDEKNIKIKKMANTIVDIQTPLFQKEIYFYSDSAQKYMKWAKTNLELWQSVVEYLDDEELSIGITGITELDHYL